MWMLDRSDALYKDLYGFYGDDYDWLESPFALKEPYRLTASDENEAMEIKDVMLENEGITRETNRTNVTAKRPRELVIVKDVDEGIKIIENQQQ